MCTQDQLPLFEALKKYTDDKYLRMHMPGHKGHSFPDFFSGFVGDKLFALDVTELPGTDDLHAPTGPIAHAEALASKLYNAAATVFLVNGATQGINSLMMLQKGKKVLIPRHAHKALYHGLILSEAQPIYLRSKYSPDWGVATGGDFEHFKDCMQENQDISQVWLTSPTYFGHVENIKAYKEHIQKDTRLFVDEAHGSHLKFLNMDTALGQGADATIQSWHKTLGAFTQSAVIHFAQEDLARETRQIISLTETTSPSYLLMLSLDSARRNIALHGQELVEQALKSSRYLRVNLLNIKGINVMPTQDQTKIAFSLEGYSGEELYNILMKNGIMPELAQGNFVLLQAALYFTKQDAESILKTLKNIPFKKGKQSLIPLLPTIPERATTPREGFYGAKVSIPLQETLGKVSGEFVTPYPPGIPVVVPGEIISEEIRDYMIYLKKAQVKIHGAKDLQLKTLAVLR